MVTCWCSGSAPETRGWCCQGGRAAKAYHSRALSWSRWARDVNSVAYFKAKAVRCDFRHSTKIEILLLRPENNLNYIDSPKKYSTLLLVDLFQSLPRTLYRQMANLVSF